jgi:glutamyl-tRNA synthetase
VLAYRDAGYLPEAVLNYIVRLGWSHGDQELFSLEEMTGLFNFEGVNESAASFDPDKFLWVNEQWLKRASTERLSDALTPFMVAQGFDLSAGPPLGEIVEVQRDRASTLVEMVEKSAFIYIAPEQYAAKAAKQHFKPGVSAVLETLDRDLGSLDEWSVDATQAAVEATAERLDLKMGKVAQPLRVAVTGDSASPGIGQTLYLLGREETLQRVQRALDYVNKQATA